MDKSRSIFRVHSARRSAVPDLGATVGKGREMIPQEISITDILRPDELRFLGEIAAYGAMIEELAAGIHGAEQLARDDPELPYASTEGRRVGWLLLKLKDSADDGIRHWAISALDAVELRHRLVHTA